MGLIYLGIETSCDDTSCALWEPGRGVVVHRTAAQLDHGIYGGVVPEIASRSHMRALLPLWETVMAEGNVALDDLAGIGVTNGPGLVGSLLVGLSFAKGLAYGAGLPLVGVHHIEGHILANALEGSFDLPATVLVVSGGHTQLFHVERIGSYEYLGGTRDDAAGEAFDKIGKLLGLPYPGGPAIDRAAVEGDPAAFDFPRALRGSGECDFSFSGLKTAVRRTVETLGEAGTLPVADLAAAAQEAIVDILAEKTLLVERLRPTGRVFIAGGVAANSRLRAVMRERLGEAGVAVSWPSPVYCTDNAAMIACAASLHLAAGRRDGLDLNTFPRGRLFSWS
ncbi:MAG TPA: tRNA (adenosine(37)-N6)-threonylcarbamoyltransferase complex transferase subunit TsaD [Alphaproteobacteria bacterium]|nr:tRNA (adenosine(37)-N6)-threonylcarbamoyltransferase complex transferase subunit TsaD [Alphaproteobacteria bacterium]